MKTRNAPGRSPRDDSAADHAGLPSKDTTTGPPPAIDAQAADQARALLREVSALANSAIRLSVPRAAGAMAGHEDGDCDDCDDRDDRIQMLRQTLERIGWVADVALRQLGDPGAFARAEDWMLARL